MVLTTGETSGRAAADDSISNARASFPISSSAVPRTRPPSPRSPVGTVNGPRRTKVRSWPREWRPAGAIDLRWDGRDDDGRITASGIYHLRARVGAAQATTKLVLTR